MSSAAQACSGEPRMEAYRVIKQIGKGSYGQVFLVKHNGIKKQYVVKKIKLTASSAKERLAAEQEAALLSRLHHPNIVSYKESFQDSHGVLHIVMGYCEGGDLCTRLKTYEGRLLPETQVVEWFVQIALALQYLHERKILHRDLKTQNIFLSKNDIIKVGDLGIARVLDGSCELAHTVIGTPYYMSPELFSNQPYNHKSDIWALGCCVYEMATLKHAFTARNINALMYKILQGKVPPLPSKFSLDLTQLVQLMMSSNAKDRPSVNQILRMSFIREHIKMFLDRTANKRRRCSSGQVKPPAAPCRNRVSNQSSYSSSATESHEGHRRRSSSASSGSSARSSCRDGQAVPADSSQHDQTTHGHLDADQHPVKSRSLSLLPQSGEDKISDAEKSDKEQKQKRAPRPLPPNPVHKEESSPSQISKINHIKPPLNKATVSSARERRRKSKKEGGLGRVILKSRSAADLCRVEVRKGRVNINTPPDRRKGSNSEKRIGVDEPDSEIRLGMDELDSDCQTDKEDKSKVEKTEDDSQRMIFQGEGEADQPDSGQSHGGKKKDTRDKGFCEDPALRKEMVISSGKTEEELVQQGNPRVQCTTEPAEAVLNGHSSDEVEVEEFFTLLDTTLHLPDPPLSPVPFESEDHPGPPLKAFSTNPCVKGDKGDGGLEGDVPGERKLPPGRLADRIKALRDECIRELGEPVMDKAYKLLDKADPEQAEEVLLGLLGRDAAFLFTGKLQQLKLCEDSLYEL